MRTTFFRSKSKFCKSSGLTLVELIVVVTILALFAFAVIFYLLPGGQLSKAKNTRRQVDINEIKKALEIYYHDHNCYPPADEFSAILASNSEWSENGGRTIYMKKVPIDPENYAYIYKTDESSCPQWMTAFAKLSTAPVRTKACALTNVPSCEPQGLDDTWACVISGDIDCDYLATSTLTQGSQLTPTPTPTPTITPIPTITPTPTPTPSPCVPRDYACTGTPLRCNIVPPGTGTYCTSNCDGVCP